MILEFHFIPFSQAWDIIADDHWIGTVKAERCEYDADKHLYNFIHKGKVIFSAPEPDNAKVVR